MKISKKELIQLINEEVFRVHEELGLTEKAKSKQQQKFMGMVHAFQKGELSADEVSKELKKTAASMSPEDTKDFASTKHKGLPDTVDKDDDGGDLAESIVNEIYNIFAEVIEEQYNG